MNLHLRSHLILLVSSIALCCVAYPLVVLAVAHAVVPSKAGGSLVTGPDGQPVGSSLIAQEFKGEGYFHSRPSAAGYNAAASSGSNFGANNPKLRDRAEETLKQDFAGKTNVPADAVTASGSGLDPHITVANARVQLERVATARGKNVADVEKVLAENSFTPLAGLAGEPLVNVLEANLALDRIFGKATK